MRHQFIIVPARSDGAEGVWHVVERGRLGNLYVGEVFLVARRVLEIIMWRLELVADKERLVLIVLRLEPMQGGVRNSIGGMLALVGDQVLGPRLVALHAKLGVVILPLPREHLVVVEVRLHLQVPLTDHGRLITSLPKQDRQRLLGRQDPAGEIGYAVYVRILAGDDASPARRTDGVRAKRVVERDALRCQPVKRGRRVEWLEYGRIRTHCLRRVVVGHNEQHVGSFLGHHIQRDNQG